MSAGISSPSAFQVRRPFKSEFYVRRHFIPQSKPGQLIAIKSGSLEICHFAAALTCLQVREMQVLLATVPGFQQPQVRSVSHPVLLPSHASTDDILSVCLAFKLQECPTRSDRESERARHTGPTALACIFLVYSTDDSLKGLCDFANDAGVLEF